MGHLGSLAQLILAGFIQQVMEAGWPEQHQSMSDGWMVISWGNRGD